MPDSNPFSTVTEPERFCPELLPLFAAVYCGDVTPELRAELLVQTADGTTTIEPHIIESQLGCQQGDPLGPLLFAVAVTNALNPVQSAEQSAVPHAAYLADFNLCIGGSFDDAAVERVYLLLQRLRDIGLEVNKKKSLDTAQRRSV
jgi:Reverse transcriptase (RNA-dependent DNA polymerase)